jgi:hypothetical protein
VIKDGTVLEDSALEEAVERYERKLWMRDLVMGVAYPPVDR